MREMKNDQQLHRDKEPTFCNVPYKEKAILIFWTKQNFTIILDYNAGWSWCWYIWNTDYYINEITVENVIWWHMKERNSAQIKW